MTLASKTTIMSQRSLHANRGCNGWVQSPYLERKLAVCCMRKQMETALLAGAHSQQHHAQYATAGQGSNAHEDLLHAGAHTQQQQQDGHPYSGTSEQPPPAGDSTHENWANQQPMDATTEARQQHARCTPCSQGLFASALRFAQGYYNLGYAAGSEEHEVRGLSLAQSLRKYSYHPGCV